MDALFGSASGFALALVAVWGLAAGASRALAQDMPTQSRIELWDRERGAVFADRYEPVSISLDGLVVRERGAVSEDDAYQILVPLYEVRTVSGAFEERWTPYAEIARTLWRGQARLRRGDVYAAEPLYETAYTMYRSHPGVTTREVAEGLTRCRLRRAATGLAIETWLVWRANRVPEGADVGSQLQSDEHEIALRTLMDERVGLIPEIHPFWRSETAAGYAAHEGLAAVGTGEAVAVTGAERALEALYRVSARFEAGLPPDRDPEAWGMALESSDPGVRLVRAIVLARVGGPDQRRVSREILQSQLTIERRRAGTERSRPWVELWCRVGLGRSLVMESESELVRQGVIELLHGPARFADSYPMIAGGALADAADALERIGDRSGAARLRDELDRLFSEMGLTGSV